MLPHSFCHFFDRTDCIFHHFHRDTRCIYRPPSARITWPVIYDDMSDARNNATLAISAGVPRRFMLHCCMNRAITSSAMVSIISVSIIPGAIAFTRICAYESSRESFLVAPIRAALLHTYSSCLGSPSIPAIEAMLMMLPELCRVIAFNMYCVMSKGAKKFTSKTSFIVLIGVSWNKAFLETIPALFTTMSTGPFDARISFIARATWSRSDRSKATGEIRTEYRVESSSISLRYDSGAVLLHAQISAPFRAKSSRMLLPIPREHPVITAVFP